MTAPDPTAGERACRYPCDCGQFHDEHCACMDGHAPAAPETDVSTPRPWPADSWPTAAELADWLSRCTSDERLSYADHSLATAQRAARCVDQQHAALLADLEAARERVRVVEGERDAARAESDARVEGNDYMHRALSQAKDRENLRLLARAESAEAAHRALQAEVEALAVEWDRYGPMAPEAHQILDDLRALLAGGEER